MNKKRSMMFSLVRGLMAILIALGVAALLIFISAEATNIGDRFVQTFGALRQLLISPILRNNGSVNVKNVTDVLAAMIPILFTGLATCVMFSANQFNMGAEGGIMLGAFVTALVAIYVPIPGGLLPIVAILIGAAAVGVMMLIPSILKVKMGVSEMVCSLMMNYVVMYFIKYTLNTQLADKSRGQIMTFPFQENAAIPQLIDNGSKLSWGFVVGIVFVILTALFMYRTRWGYAIRMIGINQDFAKYSGMKVGGIIILAQVLGGVLAGMGGGIEMLGRYSTYAWSSLPGYGWTGITVAILAGNNPAFVPLAAFFMAYLNKGCNLMSTYSGVPAQLIDIIQAVIFLFFAAEQFLSGYRQKLVVKSAQEELQRQAEQAAAEGSVK
ncbi:MAG: ABC transporter permease [Ruminococcaceae bacterium]|nr:ABC transporter permease [Oscillospiraceae bacterium]